MEHSSDPASDGAFFGRLGIAFAVSILVSGVMMFAVGPVAQDEGQQMAANTISIAAAGR